MASANTLPLNAWFSPLQSLAAWLFPRPEPQRTERRSAPAPCVRAASVVRLPRRVDRKALDREVPDWTGRFGGMAKKKAARP